ncbi:hypothetical protein ACHAXT_001285 [Thalassiosira profunda]
MDSASPDGSHRDAAAAPSGESPSGGGGARSAKASEAASLAAVVEATTAHRALLPGLAELMGGSGALSFKGAAGLSSVVESKVMHADGSGEGEKAGDTATEAEPIAAGHPHLPSMEAVSAASARFINDSPPFVTMSARDTAPQLKLEDPPAVEGDASDGISLQRKLVVKGGMKGYRMSRATHGVTSGCYYYEAVILSEIGSAGRGRKRSFQETEDGAKENEPQASLKNGHLRIGWGTRSADLQAPVGYNEHSYAVRDIGGSRIHKSRREDKWGGVGFGPGDVVGLALCLVDNNKPSDAAAPATSLGNAGGEMDVDAETASEKGATTAAEASTLANHIRFFKNGVQMGGGIAFDKITPGTYHPSVSCYMDSAVQMNFGPHFICPPQGLPSDLDLRPVSSVCPTPPLPEAAEEKVVAGGSKEGKKFFSSKRTDEGVLAAFKELVKAEATARREAYAKQLQLHRAEVLAFRKERGLPTADLA